MYRILQFELKLSTQIRSYRLHYAVDNIDNNNTHTTIIFIVYLLKNYRSDPIQNMYLLTIYTIQIK